MHNDPTLRDVTQAFAAWLMAESQGIKDWSHGLGDIHVSTMMSILLLGCTILFGWILRNWLVQLMALAQRKLLSTQLTTENRPAVLLQGE